MQNERTRKCKPKPSWKASEKPVSKRLAWLELVKFARHNPTEWHAKNWTIPLERGYFYCRKSNLAKRWGWTDKKVRRFFKMLENKGKLSQVPMPGVGSLCQVMDLDNVIKDFMEEI